MSIEFSKSRKYLTVIRLILSILSTYISRKHEYICVRYNYNNYMYQEFPELHRAIHDKLETQADIHENRAIFMYPHPFQRICRIGWLIKFAWQWKF